MGRWGGGVVEMGKAWREGEEGVGQIKRKEAGHGWIKYHENSA